MKSLQPLKQRESLFSDFYVFDTETNGLRAKSDAFIFGVIYGNNFVKVLYSVEEFQKEFLSERYKKKKVFAHNAEYDLGVLYDNIYEMDKRAIFNGRFICATNGVCTFADSLNIFPASVKEIGRVLGTEKLEINEGFVNATHSGNVTEKDIEYCTRDCEIVYNALLTIFTMVGQIKITLAGLSLSYFRRYFLSAPIEYNEKLSPYFFESYFGGRTEAFFIGKVKGYCYDINSMYPDAMKYCKFPNPKNLKIFHECKVSVLINKYLEYYEGVAHVDILHKEHHFGFLPFKQNGKLLFPVGNFSGWYNFNELRFALSVGVIEIKKCYEVVFAEPVDSPFIHFVDYNYNKRMTETNELNRLIIKLLLNSLYGKFAQRIKSEMIYIKDIEQQISLVEEYERKKQLLQIIPFNAERLDCFIEVKNNKGYLYNTIPVYSSYITSHARVKLLQNLLLYRKYNPLYCDTDSIFFSEIPPIKDSKELGFFKRENKIITEIRGLKNYDYIDEVGNKKSKIKGIPKNAKMIAENTYEYANLIRTREATRRQDVSGIQTKRTKVLSLKYDKRIVDKTGNSQPIKL